MELVIAALRSVAELGALDRAEDSYAIMDAERDATLVTTCVRTSPRMAPELVRVVSRIDPELRLQAEGRTLAVHRRGDEPMAPSTRTRDRRLEIRTTAEERELIDRAAGTTGTDLTSFVVSHLVDAARQVLADRDRFVLSVDVAAEWEKVNRRPAGEFAGLRRLMQRPSPFAE